MKPERMRFEIDVIYNRINEMLPEYTTNRPKHQAKLVCINYDKENSRILIQFTYYLYEVKYDNDIESYLINWYSQDQEYKNKFYKNGSMECDDLAKVIRTIDHFIYSGFSPIRSKWWESDNH